MLLQLIRYVEYHLGQSLFWAGLIMLWSSNVKYKFFLQNSSWELCIRENGKVAFPTFDATSSPTCIQKSTMEAYLFLKAQKSVSRKT